MQKLPTLPDDILEKQICTNCFQYLSVLPIYQNKRNEIYCGRCETDFKKNIDLRPSLKSKNKAIYNSVFNVVARNYLFKCVNHYEGCKALVDVGSTEKHEKECQYEPHECFFCSFRGNWCQVVHHCLKEHSTSVTKDGLFQFKIGSKFFQKLIFTVGSNIFFCTIEITEEKCILIVSPEANDVVVNQFAVKFFIPSDSSSGEFIFNNYSLFDVNSLNYFEKDIDELVSRFGRKTNVSCQILLKQVKLSEKELELEKRFINFNILEKDLYQRERSVRKREEELIQKEESIRSVFNLMKRLSSTFFACLNCRRILSNNVYFCSENHCYCEGCLSSKCKGCNKICEFANIVDLNKIVVTCDWPNCTESVSLPNYSHHKINCSLRPYKCPLKDCLETVYSCEKLIDHWHCQVPSLIYDEIIEYDKYIENEYYWLLNKDLYHVAIAFTRAKVNIIIEETAVLSSTLKFKIEGYTYCNNWKEKPGINFCGKYMVIFNGQNSEGDYYTKIRLSILGI